MEVRDVRIEDSPFGRERARLRGEVRYETGACRVRGILVRRAASARGELSLSGNPGLPVCCRWPRTRASRFASRSRSIDRCSRTPGS